MRHKKTWLIINFLLFALYFTLFHSLKIIHAQNKSIQNEIGANISRSITGTSIPGGNVSGLFNLSGSPYFINGDITVPDQQLLTIDAGVEIIFNGSFKLTVNGRILANGTVTDSVHFKSINNTYKWRGIRFEDISGINDTSKLKYCIITGSQASDGTPGITSLDNGGALYIQNTNKLIVTNCNITQNTADNQGGGVYILNSKVILRNNHIINNYALADGGGIYAIQNSQGTIQNNKIENNHAANAGGVMLDACYGLIFNNNLIGFNIAVLKAGGIYFANGTNGKYANNTISRNKCAGLGDGIYISSSNPNIYNSIIWYNEEGGGANVYINNDGSVPNFYYSNIQNGSVSFAGPPGWTYTGIYQINVDFTPGFWGWGSDYFDLNFLSPSVNRGTPDTSGLYLPKTDISGSPRCFNNGQIDMGAYEFQGTQYMNTISGNLSGILTTVGTPYFVTGNIIIPEGQTLTLEKGIQLYFLGHFSITVKGNMIASGDESETIFFTSLDTMDFCKSHLNNGGWNRIIIESTSTASVFNNCRFEFSKAVKPTDVYPQTGGSVLVNGSNPKFFNCQFFKNVALNGGGLAILNTNKTKLENCTFTSCVTLDGGKGAALYIKNASPDVFGSLFNANSACDINKLNRRNSYPPPSLIKSNYTEGVIYISNSESKFINNTITENHVEKGGAFYINEDNGLSLKNKLKFYNNIIWSNSASNPSNGDQFYINSPTDSILMKYNDIEGGLNAFAINGSGFFNGIYQNNLDEDPRFTLS